MASAPRLAMNLTPPSPNPSRNTTVRLLLVAASICLALGFALPAFDIYSMLDGTASYSILSGIVELARSGSPVLAVIVCVFSVVFPVVKLALMVSVSVSSRSPRERLRTARWLMFLGRWSMLDVFVVVILIGAVHLGLLSSAAPRTGVYLFGSGILLSMLAAGQIVAHLRSIQRLANLGEIRLGRSGIWAPAIAAILFATGISLPLIDVDKWLFWGHEYSVVSAVLSMYGDGEAVLGTALLVFVVLLPLVRFVVMAWMRLEESFQESHIRRLLLVDEWAMLDVYVFALFIVATKITDVAGVTPRIGLFLLAASAGLSLYDSWRVRASLPA